MPNNEWLKQQGKIKMVCCSVPWSVGLTHAMMPWCQRHAEVQTSQPEAPTLFMDTCSHSQDWESSKCWCSVFGLVTDIPNVSTKLKEALWRHCEDVLRTSFRLSHLVTHSDSHERLSPFKALPSGDTHSSHTMLSSVRVLLWQNETSTPGL